MHIHEHEAALDLERGDRPARDRDYEAAGRETLDALRAGRTDAATPEGIAHLQRTAGNTEVGRLVGEEDPAELVHGAVSGSGQTLDPGVQRTMEAELGADLSDVRVHTDARAHESAQALSANAYTVGSDVVFQQGKYDPDSRDGQHTLAHELTHVAQQRKGPVDGTPMGDTGIAVSDPSDRFEQAAERTADRVLASDTLQRDQADDAAVSVQRQGPEEDELQMSVQRQEPEDDEELQMSVQREAGEEEDEEVEFP